MEKRNVHITPVGRTEGRGNFGNVAGGLGQVGARPTTRPFDARAVETSSSSSIATSNPCGPQVNPKVKAHR